MTRNFNSLYLFVHRELRDAEQRVLQMQQKLEHDHQYKQQLIMQGEFFFFFLSRGLSLSLFFLILSS